MEKRHFKLLNNGGHIAIAAPSGAISSDYLRNAIEKIEKEGYTVEILPSVEGPRYSVFSATDIQRATDIARAIQRDDVDAIICARGGYGAVRTLQLINPEIIKNCNKWIVGFSDITVFHSALTYYGIPSMHGPMLKHIATHGMQSEDVRTMFELLHGKNATIECKAKQGSREGRAKGKLIGGNLSLIYSLRNTPIDINPRGAILFIEDLSEYNYHIDRMIQNLRYSGVLSQLSGLVVGQMTDMKDGATPFGVDAYQIIVDAVSEYDYPVLVGYQAGHDSTINMPLVMGRECVLEVACDKGRLQF